MQIFRGLNHPGMAPAVALTIGSFDGVHRGHQAMLALLHSEARHRGLPSCVLTFEPHPRDFFARLHQQPDLAPKRIGTLRDKWMELRACGVDQCVVLPFNLQLSQMSAEAFVREVLVQGMGAQYILVGDDFRFGAKRAGNHDALVQFGQQLGFEVARMNSYELSEARPEPGTTPPGVAAPAVRVSSSLVRQALANGQMDEAARLLGRPYAISGHVVHGRKLGRELQCPTLNLRFRHTRPAAQGIFVSRVLGLSAEPLMAVSNFGTRPSLDPNDVNGGRVLLETHCLEWPAHLGSEGGYGKLIVVELLHKLHDELVYDSLDALNAGIAKDCADARAWFASRHGETHRQTTRDRI
jgi:riboflavin kinase/FMN adenylyltransferase